MIVISFQNCENDEIPITIEMKGNSKVEKISFEDFKSNLNNLITLNKFNGLLDISKQKTKK